MANEALEGRRVILATMALAGANFMVVLDTTIANVSIPHIAGGLGVSPDQATWTITSYAVADAITVTLAGWLAQRFGALRAFKAALIGFAFFSALCGTSVTLGMLVAARIGQGLCGGPLIPLSQTLIMRLYTPENRAKGMSYWAMTTMMGPVLGPILGGTLSDGLSWHWIFIINLPPAAMCFIGVSALLGRIENERIRLPIDWIGFLLMIIWIGALEIVLDIGREHDWFADPTILVLALVSVVVFVIFVIWELTEEHPVVNLRVLRHRSFTLGAICFTLAFSSYYAGIIVIPQWMQLTLGYTAAQAGYATCVSGIAAFSMSSIPPRLMRRVDTRIIVTGGLFWLGTMTLLRTRWTSGADFESLILPQFLLGFGTPFFFTTLISTIYLQVQPREQASATGLFAFMRTMGIALAASLSLTYWDNQGRVAGSDIAGRLNSDATSTALTGNGSSFEQSRLIISQLVDKEAITLATDKVFLFTGLLTIALSSLVWLLPKPRRPGAPSGGH